MQQQDFRRLPTLASGLQAAGCHARIVEDERIARAQIGQHVGEAAMLDSPILAVKHEQAGLAARPGSLSDPFGRQSVIKKVCAHSTYFYDYNAKECARRVAVRVSR